MKDGGKAAVPNSPKRIYWAKMPLLRKGKIISKTKAGNFAGLQGCSLRASFRPSP